MLYNLSNNGNGFILRRSTWQIDPPLLKEGEELRNALLISLVLRENRRQ